MLNLKYHIIIEATANPNYFGDYSPELPGFTGGGGSVQAILDELEEAIEEHLEVMQANGHEPPLPPKKPQIIIQNEPASIDEVA